MADRPIIFSGPMVQALLAGRKSQTRRVLKPQPDFRGSVGDYHDAEEWGWEDDDRYHVSVLDICPNGFRVGDRLWVRENCATWGDHEAIYRADDAVEYGLAVSDGKFGAKWKARPSIHMPRWASRLTLTVTDVRVQRLADLTDEDAIAEGIDVTDELTPSVTYAILWDKMNAKRGFPWKSNPWIVALTFQTELNSATSDQ